MNCLLIVFSYHHKNTEQVANAIAEVFDTSVQTPSQASANDFLQADLIGLGSGIYGAKHHESLLELADTLPYRENGKAFVFSTAGAPRIAISDDFIANNHSELRKKLQDKGYQIVGEFGCAGFNTNSFLRWFGGINRGRPNAIDLEQAQEFARGLLETS